MRVAFITSQSLSRHATIKRAWGMAPHLLARGWAVSVVAEDCRENREAVAGIPGLTASYFPAGLSMLAERRAKAQCLHELKADVVQICGLGWRNAVNRRDLPGKILMDHVELESGITGSAWLRRMLQARLERWSFLHYDGSIAASRYLEHEIRRAQLQCAGSRPILYLPFAFDPVVCRAEAPQVSSMRLESLGRKTITYMGGLYASYGVRELIAAYLGSPTLCRTSRLVFYGQGPEIDFIRSQPGNPGEGAWIEYGGFLEEPDLMTRLFASDVLVSPLRDTVQDWARCPSKTYVYMATRRPIVTAPVGENREALGTLGFYYRPGAVDSLTHALERALAAEPEQPYDLATLTWAARTEQFVQWLGKEFA